MKYKEKMKQFYDKIIPLNYIIRYSNIPRIKDETVAAHSFLVAAIVIKLNDKYNFDLGRALTLAICHDMPEYEVNDITHGTKQKYPRVAAALREAELSALETLPRIVKSAFEEFERGDTVESKIVKLADVIQCLQYSENEIQLGNHGTMPRIAANSKMRITLLEDELREHHK